MNTALLVIIIIFRVWIILFALQLLLKPIIDKQQLAAQRKVIDALKLIHEGTGFEIARQIERFEGRTIGYGTLYAALYTLEKMGIVRSESANNKKYYRLKPEAEYKVGRSDETK